MELNAGMGEGGQLAHMQDWMDWKIKRMNLKKLLAGKGKKKKLPKAKSEKTDQKIKQGTLKRWM